MPERHDEKGHAIWRHKYLANHSDPDSQPRADLWRTGLLDFVQLDVDASVLWVPIGPAPLNIDSAAQEFQGIGPDSGEVTDIAIDPGGDADRNIYIATNDGGIWSTSDGGETWRPTMDQLPSLSMGAVAVNPFNPQVVYAGTGNLYDGGEAFTKGVGVYRSPDRGATWSIVDGGPFGTIFAGLGINRIAIPASDTLLVATNKGLYRSIDAGANFGFPVLNGFISDLWLDTAAPATTVYACVIGLGILKSTDAGITFANLFDHPGSPLPNSFGNVEMAQSQSPDNQTLFVLVQVTSGPKPQGMLYRSTNGGLQWHAIPDLTAVASVDGFTQTDYDLTLGVDPQAAHLVYAGFQQLWKSNDGGNTFQYPACTYSKVHWDTHVLAFSPGSHRSGAPTAVYIGTDGGIARSTDGGATWNAINGKIGSNLFRGIDIGKGPGNNAYTYGGCQDTGTSGHRPADIGATDWLEGIDGDGYFVAVDPADPAVVYGFDDDAFIKTTDAGASWQLSTDDRPAIGLNLPNPNNDFTRAIALEQNGTDPVKRIVYVGVVNGLYKSVDAGIHFGASIFNAGGNITALTTTTADSNRVWVGVADGSVHYSADAGNTWDTVSFQSWPGGSGAATGIAVDPTNAARVAVVYGGASGINSKYRTQRIFLTTDGGATWYDVSGADGYGPLGNLPDLPMHSVVFDTSASPPAIIVANDAGVMRSTDAAITAGNASATWKIYGAGLPTVCCTSLAIDNSVMPPVLRVGTYGRSCFEATRPEGPAMTVEANLAFGAVPVGRSTALPFYVYNSGDAALTVSGIAPGTASGVFALAPSIKFPTSLAPGATQEFDIVFTPANPGDVTGSFEIASNNGNHAPSALYTIYASGRGMAANFAPRLASNPIGQTGFGVVSVSAERTASLQLLNVGMADVHISAIDRISGSSDFTVDPAPVFPIAIAPGAQAIVTLKYHPTNEGDFDAAFNIVSDDPRSPRMIAVTGTGPS